MLAINGAPFMNGQSTASLRPLVDKLWSALIEVAKRAKRAGCGVEDDEEMTCLGRTAARRH